jgi:hypothetical protein
MTGGGGKCYFEIQCERKEGSHCWEDRSFTPKEECRRISKTEFTECNKRV